MGESWPPCSRSGALAFLTGVLFSLTGCAPAVQNEPLRVADYGGRPIRLACVGDSITVCANCWPDRLAAMLGSGWEVLNFGLGGSTVFTSGDTPYIELMLPEVLASAPDAVIIVLGTNDSKPRHWYYKKEFERDYRHLVNKLLALPSRPRIWIALPPPAFPGQWGIDDGRLREMQPVLRRVARRCRVPVIDLYSPLVEHPEWFPDQVHPDGAGEAEMARHIYQALTGQPAG